MFSNKKVAGQRPPGEIFEDLVEEVNGILSTTIGEQPIVENPIQEERPVSSVPETHFDGQEETKVVVHISPEISVKRKQSIDSVDLMIEEEIKNIKDDHVVTVEERLQTPAEKEIIEIES